MEGFCASRPKVLLALNGYGTILELTLSAMACAGCLRGIVVCARCEDIREIEQCAEKILPDIERIVVPGGNTRQESVFAGLQALKGKATHVLVHDAARPFCPPELIRSAAERCVQSGACILAVPVKATLKKAKNCNVAQTVPRREMWEAQTPQAFDYDLLIDAYERAFADGYTGTDDSELVERLGHAVEIIEGTDANIKITTPHDLQYAQLMLAQRAR